MEGVLIFSDHPNFDQVLTTIKAYERLGWATARTFAKKEKCYFWARLIFVDPEQHDRFMKEVGEMVQIFTEAEIFAYERGFIKGRMI